jgi:hypothetical protein
MKREPTMNRKFEQTLLQNAVALTVGLAALAAGATAQPAPHPATENPTERIGIYDSRAIAVAYAGSQFQKARMNELVSRQQKANAADDKKEVARLEAEGRAWQAQLHRQGFSAASVDDLLAHIAGELPRIRQDAGVTLLISKWNRTELRKHPSAAQIDVTMALVDAFHPSELQRKRAIGIQRKPPVKLRE